MTPGNSSAIDEARLRELIEAWAQALRAKDINGIMSHYAVDIVTFALAPPLQCEGVAALRKSFEEWFPTFHCVTNPDSAMLVAGYEPRASFIHMMSI